MEDAIKEMKRAIRNYILATNYDEMDEDARIEKFWQDLGDNFFSDEAVNGFLAQKSAIELWKEAALEKLKEAKAKREQERDEMGEEAFLKKYPTLTFEEKREKMAEIIRNKWLERNAEKRGEV
jgi:succinate dehydrogenase/fumarate reductase flavoprotein subunit